MFMTAQKMKVYGKTQTSTTASNMNSEEFDYKYAEILERL